MRLESDVDKVYGAAVCLYAAALMLRITSQLPPEKQLEHHRKLLRDLQHKRPHPSREYGSSFITAALQGEINRLEKVIETCPR